ncbi:MAG: methylmalonyl-CoA epimerase, partial [Deltaproteobacteria bacterium]|nr:methylmalonyl-CoA epimerase [Deltaproteobacteria bacterium]
FIEKNGEGVMLISFNVDNTREAIDELKAKDYPFIPAPTGEIARPFRNCEFAFIHPKKLNGVLTELIDDKWDGKTI